MLIPYLELDIAHGFVTQGAFSAAPLESLHYTLLDGTQQLLVHFGRQSVIEEQVRAVGLRTKRPDVSEIGNRREGR